MLNLQFEKCFAFCIFKKFLQKTKKTENKKPLRQGDFTTGSASATGFGPAFMSSCCSNSHSCFCCFMLLFIMLFLSCIEGASPRPTEREGYNRLPGLFVKAIVGFASAPLQLRPSLAPRLRGNFTF